MCDGVVAVVNSLVSVVEGGAGLVYLCGDPSALFFGRFWDWGEDLSLPVSRRE